LQSGKVHDEQLKTALGSTWEVSSVVKVMGSVGLPLRGDIACCFARRTTVADPARILGPLQAGSVVPMINLLKTVNDSLEQGWSVLCAADESKTSQTVPPADLKSVVSDVAKTGRLPACDLDSYTLPAEEFKTLSDLQMRRAVALLVWVVHHGSMAGACCDLDDATGPIFLGGALPTTGGLKMFIALSGASGGIIAKTLTPYHILAVRGYVPPDCINLSVLAPKTAHRAAGRATPATAAMACILACMRALQ